MKKLYKFTTLFFLIAISLLLVQTSVTAKNTAHLIIVSDDHAVGIGKACKKDAERVSLQWSSLVGIHPNLNPKFYKVNDVFLNRKHLIDLLNKINSREGDILLFYFTGHGFWHKQQKDTYMKLGAEGGDIGLKEIKKILECKPSKARYYITDCCKKDLEVRAKAPKSSDVVFLQQDISNIQKLLAFQGIIEITSCRRNQISYTLPDDSGSFFTSAFTTAMWNHIRHPQKISWQNILKVSKKTTKENVKKFSLDLQEPDYSITFLPQ